MMASEYFTRLNIGLDQKLAERLHTAAADADQSLSGYIRKALRAALERDGYAPPQPRPCRGRERWQDHEQRRSVPA